MKPDEWAHEPDHGLVDDVASEVRDGPGCFEVKACRLILLWPLVFLPMGGQTTDGYGVTGVVESTFFRPDGGEFENQVRHFDMEVEGNRWRLTSYEASSNRWVLGSTGEAIFQLFIDSVEKSERPVNIGYVEPGPMPSGDYASTLPWLAFASSPYLDAPDALFAPWANPYWEPLVHAYEWKVERIQATPFLPAAIEFVASELRMTAYETGPYLRRQSVGRSEQALALARVKSVEPGFIGGVYRVVTQTNFDGLVLPLEFELIAFRETRLPHPHTNSPLAAIYRGKGIGYRKTALERPLPDVSERPVQVNDRRFRDAERPLDRIQYHITNRWLLSTNDPQLLSMMQSALAQTPRHTTAESRRLLTLTALVLLAAGLPIIWFARGWRKRLASEHGRFTGDTTKTQ